jgi:hypothetical protein
VARAANAWPTHTGEPPARLGLAARRMSAAAAACRNGRRGAARGLAGRPLAFTLLRMLLRVYHTARPLQPPLPAPKDCTPCALPRSLPPPPPTAGADDVFWWPLLLRGDAPLFRGLFAFQNTHDLCWWRLAEVPRLPGLSPLQLLDEAGGEAAAAASAAVSAAAAQQQPQQQQRQQQQQQQQQQQEEEGKAKGGSGSGAPAG